MKITELVYPSNIRFFIFKAEKIYLKDKNIEIGYIVMKSEVALDATIEIKE